MSFRFPLIDLSKKWKVFWIGYATFCFFYLGLEFAFSGNAYQLPPSPIDNAIPFVEWTVAIYLSHFVLVFLAAWKIQDRKILSVTFYSMALASITSFLAFAIFPTRISQDIVVQSESGGLVFSFLSAMGGANCLPSLHVSIASLASFGLYRSAQRFSIIFLVWPVLIWISTLTTKQHYFLDVLGGLLVAGISFGVTLYLLEAGADSISRAGDSNASGPH